MIFFLIFKVMPQQKFFFHRVFTTPVMKKQYLVSVQTHVLLSF